MSRFPLYRQHDSMQCGIACLVQEGTAATATAAITEETVKSDLIDTRTELVKAKGRANVVMCTPEYYGLVLKAAGKDFTPNTNDRIAATGNVGNWLGFTFVEVLSPCPTNWGMEPLEANRWLMEHMAASV